MGGRLIATRSGDTLIYQFWWLSTGGFALRRITDGSMNTRLLIRSTHRINDQREHIVGNQWGAISIWWSLQPHDQITAAAPFCLIDTTSGEMGFLQLTMGCPIICIVPVYGAGSSPRANRDALLETNRGAMQPEDGCIGTITSWSYSSSCGANMFNAKTSSRRYK